jgi:hypothetical protein
MASDPSFRMNNVPKIREVDQVLSRSTEVKDHFGRMATIALASSFDGLAYQASLGRIGHTS